MGYESIAALVSALASAFAAIAAAIACYQTRLGKEEDREAKRPFFVLEAPGIKQLDVSPPFRVNLPMRNVGTVPALNVCGRIIFADSSTGVDLLDTTFELADPIPANSPTPWYIDTLMLPSNAPVHFITLLLTYIHPLTEKQFSQAFFMKWNGVQNGSFQPDFVYVSIDEAKEQIKRIKQGPSNGFEKYADALKRLFTKSH